VRLMKIAKIFQLGHNVSHSGRGYGAVYFLGDMPGTDRLSNLQIILHNKIENKDILIS
jgi:hypothetical protein